MIRSSAPCWLCRRCACRTRARRRKRCGHALPELQDGADVPGRDDGLLGGVRSRRREQGSQRRRDGVAWIWDVKTGHRLVRMSPGGFSVTGGAGPVAFNPAGTEVAVGYADGTVAVFDARSGKEAEVGQRRGSAVSTMSSSSAAQASWRSRRRQALPCGSRRMGRSAATRPSSEPASTIAADPRNPQEFAVATSQRHGHLEHQRSRPATAAAAEPDQGAEFRQ